MSFLGNGEVERAALARIPLFFPDNPTLQMVWDATSLSYLSKCAQLYKYKQIDGWHLPGERVDLEFGGIAGAGLEVLYKAVIEEGVDYETALRRAVRHVLDASWDSEGDVPKFGRFTDMWRCTGTTPFKNAKGNRAKCPWSHKNAGPWPAPQPEYCGCGSPTESMNVWEALNPLKDRLQLIRLLVMYADEMREGNLKPIGVTLPGNTSPHALIELGWLYPFPVLNRPFYLAGWFDKVAEYGEREVFVVDYKTTKASLGKQYFSQYAPNIQVDLYGAIAQTALPPGVREKYRGVAIEALQTTIGGVKHGLRVYTHTPEQKNETMQEVAMALSTAMAHSLNNYWPKNKTACFFCEFKPICSAPPSAREHMLKENFKRSRWNPLIRQREEIVDAEVVPCGEQTPGGMAESESGPHSENGEAKNS